MRVHQASFIGNLALAALVCAAAALTGGTTTGLSTVASVVAPPVNGQFDDQIGGAYPPASSVKIVDRDRTARPATGKYNLCYLNAFQTQDNEASFWTGKHPDLLLQDDAGRPVNDPNWPGEYLLDTSTKAKRTAIAAIENAWIDGCAAAGFQAVDPDNLDTWSRSGGRLTQADNLALATLLATHAHSAGLAIAQKNAAELGRAGKKQAGFDFAIAESCQVYNECSPYTRVYGSHVIEIEYTSNSRSAFTAACKARGKSISIILRDQNLVAKGRSGYHYKSC
jgi:hypothetical protein